MRLTLSTPRRAKYREFRCPVANRSPIPPEKVLRISPLAAAVLDRLQSSPGETLLIPHLQALLVLDIAAAPVIPLDICTPQHGIARRVVDLLTRDPSDTATLHEIAEALNVSGKTIERSFQAQTAGSFRDWRHRMRLTKSLELLAEDMPVSRVALEVGYGSTSAFIASLRRTLGVTPIFLKGSFLTVS